MKIVNYVREKIRNSEFKSLYEVVIASIVGVTSLVLVGFLFAATVILTERLI